MAVETAKKQGSIKPRRMKAPKPFKKRIEPWLWLMPALVFFLVFTYYPFIKTVVSSFFVVNKMGVFKQFAGFDNYVRVLKDRSFQTAIQNTFIYVLLFAREHPHRAAAGADCGEKAHHVRGV